MNKELTDRLIERLKKPENAQPLVVYRDYHPELYDIIEKAGSKNCLLLEGTTWVQALADSLGRTYILKPDYQPDPEYLEIEIEVGEDDGIVSLMKPAPNTKSFWLDVVCRDEAFVCFHDPFGKETTNAGDVPGWMRTLSAQDGDIKMHARFEKP